MLYLPTQLILKYIHNNSLMGVGREQYGANEMYLCCGSHRWFNCFESTARLFFAGEEKKLKTKHQRRRRKRRISASPLGL